MDNTDYYIIDRFEGDVVVCETASREHINYSRSMMPKDAKEGDVLTFCEGVFSVDYEKTAERRKKIIFLQKKLKKSDKI